MMVQGNTKEDLLDLMIYEIKDMKRKSGHPYQNGYDRLYKIDHSAVGSKKFIAKQPPETYEWRKRIKSILRDYLILKMQCQADVLVECRNSYDILRFRIRTRNLSRWYELTDSEHGKYAILSIEENGDKKHFHLIGSEKLIFQNAVITRIFKGNHLESINLRQIEKQPDSFWSAWKTNFGVYNKIISYFPLFFQKYIYNLGESYYAVSQPWKEYKKIIHPALLEASLAALDDFTDRVRVMEICGGDGEFAEQVVIQSGRSISYFLLEYNERAVHMASQRLKDNKKSQFTVIRTDVTNTENYFEDSNRQTIMKNESIDLIIGSGALTANVMANTETAFDVVKKCYKLLKPKGKMLLVGHTHTLLSQKHFMTIGFKVVNSFLVGAQNELICTDESGFSESFQLFNRQFYILEK